MTRFSLIISWTLCWLVFLGSLSAVVIAQQPNPHGPLPVPCENCHSASGWRPIRDRLRFDHNRQTEFPLRGGHARLPCTQCHANAVFTDVGKNCDDCHADIHLRKFGSDCAQCHVAQSWSTSRAQVRNHNNLFPLIGAHAAVECEACHKAVVGGQYRVLPYCSTCHLAEFRKATNPNHQAQGFSLNCETCHSQDRWLGAFLPRTQFPQLGRRNGANR